MTGATWAIISGVVCVVLGVVLRWRTSRYDLKDAAIESAWTLARGRRTAEHPTAIEQKFNDIRARPTWTGRATHAAGTVVGHFIAQAAAVASLVLGLGGLLLIAAGVYWG